MRGTIKIIKTNDFGIYGYISVNPTTSYRFDKRGIVEGGNFEIGDVVDFDVLSLANGKKRQQM